MVKIVASGYKYLFLHLMNRYAFRQYYLNMLRMFWHRLCGEIVFISSRALKKPHILHLLRQYGPVLLRQSGQVPQSVAW